MLFNSYEFLIFFPAVLLGYFLIPRKLRYLWLLAASYYFYMSWNAKYALLLLFSTAVTYGASILIVSLRKAEKQKLITLTMLLCIAANIALLGYFKYANFLLDTVGRLLHRHFSAIDVLLPVGISFYIFQAIGYTVDVYRGKLEPERNFLRYALFVSFFPQLVAGPIERATNLIPQLRNVDKLELWDFKRIQRGLLLIFYGLILKMIISDRAAIAVDSIFNYFYDFNASAHLIAALLFTLQIYCDFAGYTYIAIGAARVMGIELMNNFNSPYLARSIKDFWSRWHISLSTWFKDYLYIPLGGSRRGLLRKCINLFIIFTVSGLWHGASWHFVVWGVLHAFLRVLEELLALLGKKLRTRLHLSDKNFLLRIAEIILTFALVSLAWIFFRAENTSQALYLVRSIFTGSYDMTWLISDSLQSIGLRTEEIHLLLFFIVFLFISDVFRELHFDFSVWFEKRAWLFRAACFLLLIVMLLSFGVYGPGIDSAAFIYFQF